MKTLGYYNGRYAEIDQMMIPMDDRACWFGDGVYDATYCRNYIIYSLDEHIDRFYNSAALLEITLSQSKEELKEILCDMVRKVDSPDQMVYWQATRGTAPRLHQFPEGTANIWIMLRPKQIGDTYRKIKLITAEDTRFLHCNIKTLNLIPSVMASQRAAIAGCDETVFHRGQRVTECAHSNLSILKDGVFYTAPSDNLILPGIARAHLILACKELGIPVSETPFTLADMIDADEIIVSSSGSLALAACEIDGKIVGGRDQQLLRKIQDFVLADFIARTGG